MKKTGGKLEVVAGSAHRNREDVPTDADFQRFFTRQIVQDRPVVAVIPLDHLGRLDTLRRMAHRRRPLTRGSEPERSISPPSARPSPSGVDAESPFRAR